MKRQLQYIGWAIATLLLLPSCNKLMYDDLSDCPQGVNIGFYSKTPCELQAQYPDAVKQIRLFAFSEDGTLLGSYNADKVALSKDFRIETDYYHVGETRFYAWAGSDLTAYDFSAFKVGETKFKDMQVALKRQAETFNRQIPTLYEGEAKLIQKDRSKEGTFYDDILINLLQVNNRINLFVDEMLSDHEYTSYIEDENSKYFLDASFAPDTRFRYLPLEEMRVDTYQAHFDIMKIAKGRNARLVIFDKTAGREVFNRNIVEELIFNEGADQGEVPPANYLDCTHTYNISIKLGAITNMGVSVTINQWNVVYRKIDLGN